ncbi:MAG: flavin reductase family protein [Thermoleophilaceae bacterium]|nr:flavin reductase family protein [Thermoleophilaceae bacterium]
MAVSREEFVSIMSAFPTGVAIVTTLDEEGRPRGLTTNAVCAVSAEPPMLLVCVDRTSRTLAALRHAKRFVVNFMSESGAEVCALFASKSDDKFAQVDWEPGLGGVPRLTGDALAYAECLTEQELEAGDHLILIGLVEAGSAPDPERAPILYYRSAYGSTPSTAS